MAQARAYCRNVIVAAALGVVVLLVFAGGLVWAARMIYIGNLDAMALADKVATPDPVSALDWPELHVRAVVSQPDEPLMVILLVGWPALPERAATMLVALDAGDDRSVPLLSQWCATQASVAPTRQGAQLELRRRQSLERVRAVLVAEDLVPTRMP